MKAAGEDAAEKAAGWRALLTLAEQQYGVMSVAQALQAGVPRHVVDHRVRTGQLDRPHPGVVRVVGAPRAGRQKAMAAVLWLGAPAAVSHATAAALLRLDVPSSAGAVHVSVPVGTARGRTARNLRLHRVSQLDPVDRVVVDGIPTTAPVRTIIDCAGALSAEAVEAMMMSALRMRMVSFDHLERRFLALGPRRRGAAAIRSLLASDRGRAPAESRLEAKVARLLDGSGLVGFACQHPVVLPAGLRYRLDVAWPELLVAVEADGFFWHGDQLRWKHDRRRIAALELAGWRVVQVTWDDVVTRPAETVERIGAALHTARILRRVA